MLQKLKLSASRGQKIIFYCLFFPLLCILTLLFLLCCAAFIIVNVDTPEYILIPITTILLTLSSFLDSFLTAKIFKENGLIIGVGIGFIFSILIAIVSITSGSFAFTGLFMSKILAVMFSGVVGGILGVNF